MDNKNFIVVLIFLFLFTLALAIGLNITGNAINSYSYKSCMSDNDCSGREVCCMFYGKNEGVCDISNFCPAIEEITMEDELNEGMLLAQKPKRDARYYIENTLISFLFILLVLLIAAIIVSRKRKIKSNVKVSKTSKSTGKKSKKRSRR